MKKHILNLCLLLLAFPAALIAQSGSVAIIEYIEGDPFEVLVTSPDGIEEEAYIGMEVELESTIQTGLASVELSLDPNGTILNLDQDTLFELTSIQGRRSSEETVFTLLQGRLRTVAARSGVQNRYSIKTPTAVCGIRGTEILNTVTPDGSSIICKTGSVEVINAIDSTNRVLISANEMVNTAAPLFNSEILSPEAVAQAFDSLPFIQLDPTAVPSVDAPAVSESNDSLDTEPEVGETTEETAVTEPTNESEDELASGPESMEESSTPVVSTPTAVVPTSTDVTSDEADEPTRDREPSALEKWFHENMGFEIGTIVIEGETYAKVIAQPVIRTDKMALGLYLPIIYKSNMLDPNDWYQPESNSEWSFGSDQDELWDTLVDINNDLWLKIRFFEYGNPLWDTFYLKLGNLDTMTLGHGTLVSEYNNNINFPSVRKVGINTGVTLGNFGLEALLDDAKDPSLVGGRLKLGAEKGMAFGIAGVVDINMASDFVNPNTLERDPDYYGNPIMLGTSLDLELFKINTDLMKLMAFVDGAAVTPIFRTEPDSSFNFDYKDRFGLIWDGSSLHNYGAVAGLRSELLIVDLALDLRYENGTYFHRMFNNIYDRYKLVYLNKMMSYLNGNTENISEHRLAIYGEGGFSIMDDRIRLMAGYEWPWEFDGSNLKVNMEEDYLKIGLELEKGLIPVYDISGAIYYERVAFAQAVADNNLELFDANTVLSGELVMPLAPTLDLALVASSTTVYDNDGDLQVDSETGLPKIVPVFNIETRIHF